MATPRTRERRTQERHTTPEAVICALHALDVRVGLWDGNHPDGRIEAIVVAFPPDGRPPFAAVLTSDTPKAEES